MRVDSWHLLKKALRQKGSFVLLTFSPDSLVYTIEPGAVLVHPRLIQQCLRRGELVERDRDLFGGGLTYELNRGKL